MRYYEQRYPEVDELVMVQVRQIAEMGAYVKLVCPFLPRFVASGRSLRIYVCWYARLYIDARDAESLNRSVWLGG